MRQPSSHPRDNTGWNGRDSTATTATETDPLLQVSTQSFTRQTESQGGSIRVRRSSRSPTVLGNQHFRDNQQQSQMNTQIGADQAYDEKPMAYKMIHDDASRSGNMSLGDASQNSGASSTSQRLASLRRQYLADSDDQDAAEEDHPPLLEIPEEIYGVRKSALQVLKPLTKSWLVVSIGFALTVLFGMARWTGLVQNLPFWFILLPSWLSHVGLFWCHLMSAKALSSFIAEANVNRHLPDSRDHVDRTEYLPLLQRSLKFGLKTGLISFGVFIFEILIYLRLAKGKMFLSVAFIPIWIMVVGGILDGIICKTQHPIRVACWVLTFVAMVLTCLKVDYDFDTIRWRIVVSPIVTVLSISSATLIYIVYGHQIGYYRLTESQLTAGNLYSLAALISIVLVVVIGEAIPLSGQVEIQTRLFVVLMAPLVVVLVGMGAWIISRDEFGRLLLYGGQAAVHPKKLRWEGNGWTSVQGIGVTNIPMFGEVSFQPLENKPASHIELCMCCSCYPYEEEEETDQYVDELNGHPYLAPTPPDSNSNHSQPQWLNATETV